MTQSEIQRKKATNDWVSCAHPEKKRSQDLVQQRSGKDLFPEHWDDCPFCLGHEHLLPLIVLEITGSQCLLQTRVIQNKHPALTPNGATDRSPKDIYLIMRAFDKHAIVIENSQHSRQIASMTNDSVAGVVGTSRRGYPGILKDDETIMVVICRNCCFKDRISVIRRHCPLISVGWVTSYIRCREEAVGRYYNQLAAVRYCETIEFESQDSRLRVHGNKFLIASIPFPVEAPFIIRIMPRRHQAEVSYISDAEKYRIAESGLEGLGIRYHKLNDPDYNDIVNTTCRHKSG